MGAGVDDTALESMVSEIATDLDEGGDDVSLESTPAGESEASADADDATADDEAPAPAPSAPAAPSLSAEEIADLRKHAELGKRYAPHAQGIDAILSRAFQPQGATQSAPLAPVVPDDYDELFAKPGAGQKWAKEAAAALANGDPRLLERGYGAIAERKFKERFSKYDALEKETAELRKVIDMVTGWATTANDRFAPHEGNKEALVHAYRLNQTSNMQWADAMKEGKRLAELEARAAGATPTQAKAAGVAAGKAIAAAKPKPRPGPVSEPTLRSAGGRKAPPGREESIAPNFGRGGRVAPETVEWALNKAMASMGKGKS